MTSGFISWLLYKYRYFIVWVLPGFILLCLSGIYPKYEFEIVLLTVIWVIIVPFIICMKACLEEERSDYLRTKEAKQND